MFVRTSRSGQDWSKDLGPRADPTPRALDIDPLGARAFVFLHNNISLRVSKHVILEKRLLNVSLNVVCSEFNLSDKQIGS